MKKRFWFYKLIKELILIIYDTILGDIVYRWWMGPISPSAILPLRKIGDFYIGWQKFLSYRRNFFFPISRIKIQKYYSFIILSHMTRIMEIFYGGAPHRRSHPIATFRFDLISTRQDSWGGCDNFPAFLMMSLYLFDDGSYGGASTLEMTCSRRRIRKWVV